MGDAQATSSPSGNRRNYSVAGITPMTVKMLSNSIEKEQNLYSFEDHDIGTVKVVACVRKMTMKTTQNTYLIEDGTGAIEARQFHAQKKELEQEYDQSTGITEGQYVRLFGTLRTYNEKLHLNAQSISPIEDFNEITSHMMDVVATMLHKKKKVSAGSFAQQPKHQQTHEFNQYQQSYGSDFTPIQQRVKDLATQLGRGPEGVHQEYLMNEVAREGFKQDDVSAAIEFLLSEGHLYQTEEYHVKSTDS